MVQMSSQTSMSKPDHSNAELPPLLKTSNEIHSGPFEESPEDRKVFKLDGNTIFPATPQNTIFDRNGNCNSADLRPSNICRVCQAQFSNEANLAFHLQEKHVNYKSKVRASRVVNNQENNPLSNLVPVSLPFTLTSHDPNLFISDPEKVLTATTPESQDIVPRKKPAQRRRKRRLPSVLPPPPRLRRRQKVFQRSHSVSYRPTKCVLCNTVYRSFASWQTHAVNDHILKQDPELRVEMNYVDVKTISKGEDEGSIITTAKVKGTPGRGSIQEQLKLTFCREKGSYVVKQPSFSGDLPEVASSSDGVSGDVGGEECCAGEITTRAASSPSSPREAGSSSGEISMLADKENSEPQVVGAITRSEAPAIGLVSKVPTSGTVLYLGSAASDSDRALANTGNSHMVIIQNDTLHIGTDADAESIQRLTAATGANAPQFHKRKVMESLKGVLTEELNICVEKEAHKESPIVSILNMSPFSRPTPEEVTAMISEEIQKATTGDKDLEEPYSQGLPDTDPSRHGDSGDDSSRDSMTLKIAIDTRGDSPTGPQESHHQESPKELLPNESSDHHVDIMDNDNSCVQPTSSPSRMQMPLHITLPCGIEIEQLVPTASLGRRESTESNQSEDIDVDDSGVGDRRPSGLVIDEEVRREGGGDAEDFRCKVCNALFTSDDELETHFSEAHFRGIANNILEPPESPFVGGAPETPLPPPAHASSVGSIYRTSSIENLAVARNFSINQGPPPGSRSERRPSDPDARLGEFRVTNGNFTNSQFYLRGEGPQSLLMRTPNIGVQPGVDDRNTSRNAVAQLPHSQAENHNSLSQQRVDTQSKGSTYGNSLTQRSIANLQAQLNRNPPPLSSSRNSVAAPHPAPFQYQQQPQARDPSPKNYPNALHTALNTVVQLGAQRSAPAQDARMVESLSLGQVMSNSRPTQQPQSQSSQQRNHLLAMAHHQRQQQQYQLLQQQTMRSRQVDQQQQQRSSQAQPSIAELQLQRQQAIMIDQQQRLRSQVQQSQLQQYVSQQNLLGKRPSPQEILTSIQKQARLEGQVQVSQDRSGRSPGSTGTYQAQSQSGSNSSQLATALGNGGVRLGNSVTLSVCSSDENRSDGQGQQQSPNFSLLRNSIITGQSQRSPNAPLGQNSSHMANALAVRGVTVSPASPPETNGSPGHRISQMSTSPNNLTRFSPPGLPNSVSVIQNGHSQHSSAASPPSHQFAMPQTPAPRSLDRPDRPPTVDLTTDEMNAYAAQQSRYHERRNQPSTQLTSPQRSTSQRAPAVACNLCGVLFCSLANLEEHKIHRHGLRSNGTAPTVQGREQGQGHPSPPLRTQQAQSGVRTSNNFRPSNNASVAVSQRSLFIPLLDITRIDPAKLKRLEELGVCSMIPLQGNDRALGQMGIPLLLPTINLRDGPQLPWDQLQPVGPVYAPSQVAQTYATSRPLPPPSVSSHSANH